VIKLADILTEILVEKELCPKGKAYRNRRIKAGEESSAYLNARAVKVCMGLMKEDEYDDQGEGKQFDLVKQNPFNIKKLIDKKIIFVTKPGNGKGGVEEPNWEGDASIITLYNMTKAEPWMKQAVKSPMPQAIPYIQNNQDKLLYNGKYNQILWGIKKMGLKPEDFYLDIKKSLNEDIDPSEAYNDVDAIDTLKDKKRDVAFIVAKSNTPENWKYVQKVIQDNGIKVMYVKGNPYDAYVAYLPGSENKATQLKDLAEKYGGYLASNATADDTRKIGKLLGYKEDKIEQYIKDRYIDEGLDDWFKEDWVRIDTQGNIAGPCGTMKKGKPTTRCLPRAKANSLTKDERAATSRKKVAGSKKGKQFVPNTKKAKVKSRK
jgi:hypothetical protein